MCKLGGRDHNATSYSTETSFQRLAVLVLLAEIITLRAIALKQNSAIASEKQKLAEIITLRAIALKPEEVLLNGLTRPSRDHNATSYSTETFTLTKYFLAILLSRDHNATSYSTETQDDTLSSGESKGRDHNATSYSTET